jgi:TRAP-type C4-dicarboxylate transport system permease small subunit
LFDKILQKLEKSVRKITIALLAVAMVAMVILMLLGVVDVIGRYLFNRPIAGVYGISEILLVAVVFFGWTYTLTVGGHVRLDIFISRLPPRAQAISGFITSFVGLIILGLIAWQSALKATASSKTGEVIDVVNIPIYPFQFFVAIGAFAFCLELLVQMLHYVNRLRKGH